MRRRPSPAEEARRAWLTPASAAAADALDALLDEPVFATGQTVGRGDLATLLRHLAACAAAGIPLTQALTLFAAAGADSPVEALSAELAQAVSRGTPLEAAMGGHPDVFAADLRAVIGVAERTGTLPTALEECAAGLESDRESDRALRRALTYPLVATASVAALVAVLALVADPLLSLTPGLEQAPAATRALLTASKFAPLLAIPLAAALFIFRTALRLGPVTKALQGRLDRLAWRAPGYRTVVRARSHGRLASALARLTRSGLGMEDGLRLAAPAAGNSLYAAAVVAVADRVRDGQAAADALAAEPLLAGQLPEVVRVGVVTGQLPALLDQFADRSNRERDRAVAALCDIAEPAAAAAAGLVLIAWLCGVLLPVLHVSAL